MKKAVKIICAITVLFFSCNKAEEAKLEKVVVKYKNGKVYCEGTKLIKDNKLLRINTWKFYHPNGVLSSFYEYNSKGKLVSAKAYYENGQLSVENEYGDEEKLINSRDLNENGKLHYLLRTIEDTQIETWYSDDGKLSLEETKKTETMGSDDNEYETTNTLSKEYYKSGQLKSVLNEIDDQKKYRLEWDTLGNLILKLEYKDENIPHEAK